MNDSMQTSEPYALRIYAIGARDVLEISPDRYWQISSANEVIIKALQIEQALGILLENFYAFERALLDIALRQTYFHENGAEEMMINRLSLNRHLMNLLASADAYLDHVSTSLRPILTDGSQKIDDWNHHRRNLHASSLSYRVMDALRNRGYPDAIMARSINLHPQISRTVAYAPDSSTAPTATISFRD